MSKENTMSLINELSAQDIDMLLYQVSYGKKLLDENPGNMKGIIAVLNAYLTLNDKENAVNMLNHGMQHNMKKSMVDYYKARLLMLNGELEAARDILSGLWMDGEGALLAAESLCEIYFKVGNIDLASNLVDTLIDKDKISVTVLKFKVLLLLQSKQLDQAEAFIRLLEQDHGGQTDVVALRVSYNMIANKGESGVEEYIDNNIVSDEAKWVKKIKSV